MEHIHETKELIPGAFFVDRTECEACELEDEAARLETKDREESSFMNKEELLCDYCGALMGYAYANDLNGSRFYCLSH